MAALKLPPNFPKDYLIEGISVVEDRKIGEGAYGIVKLGNYHGLTVAIKKLLPSFFPIGVDMQKLDEEAQIILESFFNECSKLSRIRHPNVIQLLGVTIDHETRLPAIVMELMHESLTQLLKRTANLPLYLEVKISHDITKALAYLHKAFNPPMVHRDLSSNNILISKDYRAKVTDLGVSKFEASSFFQRMANTPAPGTIVYMAPEVRSIPADCSPAMDIFAFGVIVIQINTHKFPHPGPEQEKGKFGLPKAIPEPERRHNHIKLISRGHPLRSIALDCIKNSPKARPSALDICMELEKIKNTSSYEESRLACQIKDGEAERIREQISTLQHDIETTRGELVMAQSEINRLTRDLTSEQREAQQLRDQFLSPSHSHMGATPVTTTQESPSGSKGQSKSKIFHKLKRKKKTKSSNEKQEIEVDEETLDNSSEDLSTSEGFAVITPNSLSEAQREHSRKNLKESRFLWTSHRCMLEGLQGVTLRAYTIGSRLYLCGGATATSQPNTQVFYCPTKNITRWTKTSIDAPQYYYASAIVNRELVLIGGVNSVDHVTTRKLSTYDSREKTWVEILPPLPTARSSASAVSWGDYLFVVGGINTSGNFTDAVEILHLSSQQWSTAMPLPRPLAGASVVIYRSRLYILGGATKDGLQKTLYSVGIDRLLSSISRINRLTSSSMDVWSHHQDSPYTLMSLCLFNGYMLAFGGNERTASLSQPAEWVWAYFPDDEFNNWTLVQRMHTPRKLCCVTPLSSSGIVVIGGNPYFSVLDVADITPPSPR